MAAVSQATILRHALDFTFTGELSATPSDRASQKRLRRYTPLQKTLTELLYRFQKQQPEAYHQLHDASASQVIYGSALGELGINMTQTAAITQGELPLSPVKFQRSVLNASYSQCAIEHGITSAATALSRGVLTTDAAIALADMLLAAGDSAHVLVLIGAEHTEAALKEPVPAGATLAYGQALWLSRHLVPTAGDFILTDIRLCQSLSAAERVRARYEAAQSVLGLIPWQPAKGGAARPSPYQRIVSNHRGEAYSSRWQKVGSDGKEAPP